MGKEEDSKMEIDDEVGGQANEASATKNTSEATTMDVEQTKLVEVKDEKDKKVVSTGAVPKQRGSSQEKKVILLNTQALSKMFKTPAKTSSEGAAGEATSSKKSNTKPAPHPSPNPAEMRKMNDNLAAALKTGPKKRVFCSNTNCNFKTDNVVDAPSYARVYFGMSRHAPAKLCTYCMKKAVTFDQESKKLVRNKENLFKLPVEIQSVDAEAVVDLDSPVPSPEATDRDNSANAAGETESYAITIEKLNDSVMEALKKFGLKKQVKQSAYTVAKEADNLGRSFDQIDSQIEILRNKVDETTKQYNTYLSGGAPVIVDIGNVDIDEKGNVSAAPNQKLAREVDGLSRTAARELGRATAELKGLQVHGNTVTIIYPKPVVSARDLFYGSFRGRWQRPMYVFTKPTPGQEVYAMPKHALHYWLLAKVLAVNLDSKAFPQKVKPRSKSIDDKDMYIKDLTGKELAFRRPVLKVNLPIGCRIIAKFKDLLKTDEEVDGMLYAGVIAEVPQKANNLRYLVFFDDGYAQYAEKHEIYPVVEASAEVWQDVDINSRNFIRDYIQKITERRMIKAQVGAVFDVELDGCWLPAEIVKVDCSLMKVRYQKQNPKGVEYEWIYRGSTRLAPLYHKIKSLESKPALTVPRRHTYSSRNATFSIEMNQDNVAEANDSAKVVKKHTGGLPFPQGQVIRTQNGVKVSTAMETTGHMIKIEIPNTCPTSRPFVKHACSSKCAFAYEEEKYRRVTAPLAIPFYLGWRRQLSGNGQVCYLTPCGVRRGTYKEIHEYIVHTQINIPIDFFSLESTIDCLNMFEPERKIVVVKDISYGKEWINVEVVNSLDYDLRQFMNYTTTRQKGEWVNVNDEDGFLTCCDCEDDCQDKEKCACFQMTMSGVSFKMAEREGTKLNSYENRRLKSHVLSGIYECNRNCKCRSTCFNRVVQNKVTCPIQVFKTVAKGWGVRALHDMPQGSFICVYTGKLLTDVGANSSGINNGDEFLAELDFIECNEQIKEEYEEDCTDIESEEPGTRSNARVAAKANGSAPEPRRQIVAKRSTGGGKMVQKAVKSTGGLRQRNDDDASSTCSSSIQTSRPVARKSGSKNGSNALNRHGNANTGGGKKPSPSPSRPPSPSPSRRSSKDESDSDDDDRTSRRAYSSFYATSTAEQTPAPRLTLREYFGKDEAVYIMDAKSMGNFGRYLNHSCDPNVFVQNLFVDTHDPRFPWVAFFTKKDVKAGTELTWDYNYEIGSVPGKELHCFCLQNGCRKRLL